MERVITVKGSSNIKVKPDLIIINIELISQKYDYSDTMQVATESIEAVERAIEEAGFDKSELKTTSFNITTNYKSYYDENNNYVNKFDGYRCEQRLELKFDLDMKVLESVITALTKSKVDPRLNIKFSVKDNDSVREALLVKAAEDARRKAEILVKASKVNLGKIININYNWSETGIYSTTTYNVESKNIKMEAAYAPNIEPDDIELSDTAIFVWEIK